MSDEPYPGWNDAFEKQKRMSAERRLEQGDDPITEEQWEKWKAEILSDLKERLLPPSP